MLTKCRVPAPFEVAVSAVETVVLPQKSAIEIHPKISKGIASRHQTSRTDCTKVYLASIHHVLVPRQRETL